MFKYINPGYGELLNLAIRATTKSTVYNPLNDVSFTNTERVGLIYIPDGIKEVWIQADVFIDTSKGSDKYNRIYVGNGAHINTGFYQNNETTMGAWNMGKTDTDTITMPNTVDGKVHTFGVHVSAYKDYDKSFMELYVDGALVYKDSSHANGYINDYEDIKYITFYGGANIFYSNIIIADHDIIGEKVIEFPISRESGDFVVQSDGKKKATAVGQKLEAYVNYKDIDSAILKSMSVGTITAVGASAVGFSHDASVVNSVKVDVCNGEGESLGSAENEITAGEGALGPVVEKTFELTEIAAMKVVLEAKHD